MQSRQSEMKRNAIVVPNDSIAKLMYYLNSVHNCVDIVVSDRLLNFRNYYNLTEQEKRELLTLVDRYRPSALRDIIFFEVEDSSYLLPETSNNFLALDDPVVIGSFNLSSNVILVDGIQSVIRRVMIFKHSWQINYFNIPFDEEKWRIGLATPPVSEVIYRYF